MRHLDLFSGIGGFALAAKWTWGEEYETVAFCEIDKFCHKVLRKNFGDVAIYEDIKKLDGTKLTSINLLTGGFPCQPFSVAGKRKGNEDDRALWPEMLRIIQEVKPRWIIGENVAGFVNMALDQSISDLENEGYEVQTFIIPACAVNAPHRRDRVWIIANNIGRGCGKKWERRGLETMDGGGQDNAMPLTESDCHACNTQSGSDRINQTEHEGREDDTGRFEQVDRNAEITGLMGGINGQGQGEHGRTNPGLSWDKTEWYEVATRFCRVDDGVSNRVDRLKGLGNAIVPQVAFEIMKAIKEIDQK